HAFPIFDKAKEISQIVEVTTDITERKRTEVQLEDEREKLFVTIQSIGDAVITTDTTGRVVLMNAVAETLTGWQKDMASGRPLADVFDIVDGETRQKVESPVTEVLAKGTVVGLGNHTILIARDGTEHHIADSAAPIRGKKLDIHGVVLVFRDITEKLKIEEELFRARKLESVGVLAGGIAHDFNNLLTGIFGNVGLAQMSLSPDHPAHEFLGYVGEAMDRAMRLTRQLLTFSKGGEPVLDLVSIREKIEESISFHLTGSNVKAHLDLPDTLWPVKCDGGQIGQVIANLTLNAKEAMSNGGHLFVHGENVYRVEGAALWAQGDEVKVAQGDSVEGAQENWVKVSVKDQGEGMPPSVLPKIFDPYFTTKETGSGLGLATVYSIVKKHRGHIDVESQEGRGTTFTLWLPVAHDLSSDAVASLSSDASEERSKASWRVLVMDDEALIRKVMGRMLDGFGHRHDVVEEGDEAVRKYKRAMAEGRPFDVVIMDLTIPGGMGGKEAIEAVLEIDPAAKVIVSSGYSTDPIMANYEAYGFRGCLVKPFSVEEVKKELSRVMGLGS
ncbi:MAG: PAS domain S-box protein, partial [Deltaproteobacteria bacterium]|nr:PAS domain S-box protein [Deltaproteobacteria bacterium]